MKKKKRTNNTNNMFTAWAEQEDGSFLPIWLPDVETLKAIRMQKLHDRLVKATEAIKKQPDSFFEEEDFLALTKMLSKMNAAFRMSVSIPASFLKTRESREALQLLPLPVSIEKADRVIEGSGVDIGDEIVVFDWFSVEDSQDKETAHLIADLIDAMVTALNNLPLDQATK